MSFPFGKLALQPRFIYLLKTQLRQKVRILYHGIVILVCNKTFLTKNAKPKKKNDINNTKPPFRRTLTKPTYNTFSFNFPVLITTFVYEYRGKSNKMFRIGNANQRS